ncbi:alpha/beta hydrolase family protein [Lignipirellula cremea]|uniref:Prolyl oligopeptidase family protein n=1 Tax=Lignipirellula cremea TaxID=2528010 RepID=A0A518DL30_9BACT|nr:prolyl oligopeptidase family serine peptidase [Lignipirellula cremea]QDU92534.1 Prolyl oligopeptidase family protein [Lignipirellula cremea]
MNPPRIPHALILAVAVAAMPSATTQAAGPGADAELQVSGIRVLHRDGQTFVTWKDVAAGEVGAGYRYSLYESEQPLTDDHLAELRPVIEGIVNNSGKHYGYQMFLARRLDPELPMATIEPGGKPLPQWTGLAVRTTQSNGARYYAVVAHDLEGNRQGRLLPGQSATTEPVAEKVAPLQPLKTGDSTERGRYAHVVQVTGTKNLPLTVSLHASSSRGGPGSDHGDYYLFWGRPEWGWRDGLPWQFTMEQRADSATRTPYLLLRSRETLADPDGDGTRETYWFGYYCTPQGADHTEPRAYNFTERRMLWLIDWTRQAYHADPERVYAEGGSMGAWGTAGFALRHPELFAAIYPNRPRTRQRGLPSLTPVARDAKILMEDGVTDYYDRMDMVKFVNEHPADLPFVGWCCGRHDGFATFGEQIALVRALTAGHHGFAFAWNNGDHSSGAAGMRQIHRWYPPEKFARNQSYPAFGNSSLDGDLGTGEAPAPAGSRTRNMLADDNGDLEGGVNLGFIWEEVVDTEKTWSMRLRNELATAPMTVDVTPRRCQKFKLRPGDTCQWTNSAGGTGMLTADAHGLVTIPGLMLPAGEATDVTLAK